MHCTKHTAKTKERRVPTPLILQQLQQTRQIKCSNVQGWNTVGGVKCLLCFLIIPIKWFFFSLTTSCDSNLNLCWEQVLGHTVPLKKQQIKPTRQPGSQVSLSCRETLCGSISGSSLLPSFTQTPPRAQKILELLPLDAVWRFPCAFECQDHFGKLHTWANTWNSWL